MVLSDLEIILRDGSICDAPAFPGEPSCALWKGWPVTFVVWCTAEGEETGSSSTRSFAKELACCCADSKMRHCAHSPWRLTTIQKRGDAVHDATFIWRNIQHTLAFQVSRHCPCLSFSLTIFYTLLWGHTAKHSDLYDDFTQAVWLSHKVIERCVCSVLVSVTNATGQMEGVYDFGDFVRCFQAALKAFQMYRHSYALPHMLLHDYFEKYIIVKKFCFHCIMHELVIFILRIVFISTS